jgi:hypothetical protein
MTSAWLNYEMTKSFGGLPSWFRRRRAKAVNSLNKKLFDLRFNRLTKHMHRQTIVDAECALLGRESHEGDGTCKLSPDPLVRQGSALKQQTERHFKGIFEGMTVARIMIHVPPADLSPAGYSLFTNFAESLSFMGVPAQMFGNEEDLAAVLDGFRPTCLLTSDHASYLENIDWSEIQKYRVSHPLRLGLTASLAEYDNTPLGDRLRWAEDHDVDFYYTFRDEAYVTGRQEYRPFFDAGYKILYLPFGANVLHYFPVAGFNRDIDFVLIASRKREHAAYMKHIASRYAGFVDGPGWKHAAGFRFNRDRDRYIYARARVGLNVHLPEQIEWACEVNERTYQLAACGVPQLIDHPKLLDRIFGRDTLFVADTPKEYTELFREILNNPDLAFERALKAQQEVFDRHTTFHRAESFVMQLETL